MRVGPRLATPFLGILFAFYLITYDFQVIGQLSFGGVITYSDWPAEAAIAGTGLDLRLNFNDFMGGIMCLVSILMTNNWNSMVDCFSYAYGANFWPRAYFALFFFLVALIILNIIISFVLEV